MLTISARRDVVKTGRAGARQVHGARDGGATRPLILVLATLVALVFVVAFSAELATWSIQPFSLLLVGTSIVLAALLRRSVRGKGHSLAFLIFVVLCVFHLGLYLQPAVTGEMPSGLGSIIYRSDWYTQASMVRAGIVILLGLLGYSAGVGVVTLLRPGLWATTEMPERAHSYPSSLVAAIGDVGTALLVLGVLAWYVISVSELGPRFFLRDYLSYLVATGGQPLPVVYLLISLGTVLAAVRVRRRMGVLALIAFLLFAVPGFVIGLRGEVLIPIVAAIPVLFRDPRNEFLVRGQKRPSVRIGMVGGLLALLFGISLVQQVRLEGLQSITAGTDRQVSAIGALQEMGYTVRVVTTSLTWHEDLKEPYRNGSTYYTPIVRAVDRVLALPRPDADNDYGLMNVEIDHRIGPIGGSMIAEAHHNFGRPGVVGVLALVGLLAAAIDRPTVSVRRVAWLGCFGLLALMHVRNSFAPIYAWAVAAALSLGVASVLSWLYVKRESAVKRS